MTRRMTWTEEQRDAAASQWAAQACRRAKAERLVDAIDADERREHHVCVVEELETVTAKLEETTDALTNAEAEHDCEREIATQLRRRVDDLTRELETSRAEVARLQARTITALCERAHAMAVEKQWYQGGPRGVPELIALIHSELSEALEAYRDGDLDGSKPWFRADGKPEGMAYELADTVIRIADMAGYLSIDLEEAIATKAAFNAKRPARHGGKVA